MAGDSEEPQLGFSFIAPPIPSQRRVFTPAELMTSLRTLLERELTDIWVEGEISNYRPIDSGHIYFTLKDKDAQVRFVMFQAQARLLRFKPENGMQIIARGRISVYEQRGELQLYAEYMEPKGTGALQVAFEQLKAKLAGEGLFDQERKQPLPALPRRIGIVTSPRGAAVQDFLNIIGRRHENLSVLIYPAQVQGESAAAEVTAGVLWFNRQQRPVDVIVIARGGGSLEDLGAFNDETLARAVAASHIPVVSAIGHETDFTIVDFVADLRAPTPSAAAELVVEAKQVLDERIGSLQSRLARAARYRALIARNAVQEMAHHQVFGRMMELVGRRQQRVDDLASRMVAEFVQRATHQRRRLDVAIARLQGLSPDRQFAAVRRDLAARQQALAAAVRRIALHRRSTLDMLDAQIQQLSPVRILERGYALIFDGSGAVIKDPSQLKNADTIHARVARGEFDAVVKK